MATCAIRPPLQYRHLCNAATCAIRPSVQCGHLCSAARCTMRPPVHRKGLRSDEPARCLWIGPSPPRCSPSACSEMLKKKRGKKKERGHSGRQLPARLCGASARPDSSGRPRLEHLFFQPIFFLWKRRGGQDGRARWGGHQRGARREASTTAQPPLGDPEEKEKKSKKRRVFWAGTVGDLTCVPPRRTWHR